MSVVHMVARPAQPCTAESPPCPLCLSCALLPFRPEPEPCVSITMVIDFHRYAKELKGKQWPVARVLAKAVKKLKAP